MYANGCQPVCVRNNQVIEELIQDCEVCLKHKNTETEPLLPTKTHTLPWSEIAADLFYSKGFTFLVIQDFYSKFPEVIKLQKTRSEDIIMEFKKVFSRYGIPTVVRSYNGPQFSSSVFKEFAAKYNNFKHVTSSPTYAQSNGMAERAVQLVKKILAKKRRPLFRTASIPQYSTSIRSITSSAINGQKITRQLTHSK